MLLARVSSFLLILVLFLLIIVPVGLLLSVVNMIVVFAAYCNSSLRHTLEHRESLLSIYAISKTVKENIKKNTIDI